MTMDELKAALVADPGKARVFEETLAGVGEDKASSKAEAISLAATAAGFEITPEEVERALASALEVDDAELDSVIGGSTDKEGRDNDCAVNWRCYYLFLHDEDDGDTSYTDNSRCWSDHICYSSMHRRGCGSGYVPAATCRMFWEPSSPF